MSLVPPSSADLIDFLVHRLLQEDIKTLVQGAFTSHTAWQLLNLSWEALFTMQSKAALTSEPAWTRVERWCGQLRDQRTQNQGLSLDQGAGALVAEDVARATRMQPPHPTLSNWSAISWSPN
ncbi:hypothetical protein RI367_003154 [Sorochytrium milnesiophthora]